MREDLHFEFKNLANKSRQGLYIYVKKKGTKGAYYKYDNDVPIDGYLAYYEQKFIKKKKTGSITRYVKQFKPDSKRKRGSYAQKYYDRIKQQKPLGGYFTTGVSDASIENVYSVSMLGIRDASGQMLQKLVLDDRILDVVTKPENIDKLKLHIEYIATFKNEDGENLAIAHYHGKNPYEVVDMIKRSVQEESEFFSSSRGVTEILDLLGFTNIKFFKEGSVKRVQLKLIFRKGK